MWTISRLGLGYAIAVGVALIVRLIPKESLLQPEANRVGQFDAVDSA
jgi:hypothetical protein